MLSRVGEIIEFHSIIRRLQKQYNRSLTNIEKQVVVNHVLKETLIKKHFKNVKKVYYFALNDFMHLYKESHLVNYNKLKENIEPYFAFVFKHIYDDSSKKFGYLLRNVIFKDIAYKAKQATLEIQEKEINSRYNTSITESLTSLGKDHIDLVSNTIVNDIQDNIYKANQDYNDQVQETRNQINKITIAISAGLFLKHKRYKELKKQKDILQQKLVNLEKERSEIIRTNLGKSLKSRFDSRAKTTTFQEVGTSQSMSQNVEAESITAQSGVVAGGAFGGQKYVKLLTKVWSSILDRKTRVAHAYADGQIQDISNAFVVGGEALRFPRDPNGSAENTINCRCDLVYVIGRNSI